MGAAIEVFGTLRRELLMPGEELTVSEWADRYRQIAIGDVLGRWDTGRTPYLKGIMDAASDPRVRTLVIMMGSQLGGTEAIYNIIFWLIDCSPGLIMMVYPDAGSSREQNMLRFLPTIRKTPRIARHLTERKHDAKAGRVTFRTCDLLFRGTVSEHQLESVPCRAVCVDELDRCGPRTAHLAQQRIKTYPGGKLILVGKPGLKGEGIDAEYDRSDRQRWLVPCPHCGVYHERSFRLVRWPGKDKHGETVRDSRDLERPVEEVRHSAWLKCPACKGACEAQHNAWQSALGVWCPSGGRVSALAKDSAGAWIERPGELKNAERYHERTGFALPEYASTLMENPYGEAAAGWVARKGQIDQDWVNDHDGRGWSISGASVEVKHLRERIAADVACGLSYKLGEVPAGVLLILAAIDVQETCAFVTVDGFGTHGIERWHLWHERIDCPPTASMDGANALGALDELLYRRVWTRADGATLRIYARGIDTGDRTDEVYDYIRTRKAIVGVRGVGVAATAHAGKMDGPYQWRTIDKTAAGKALPGGVRILRINSGMWKGALLRLLGVAGGGGGNEAGELSIEAQAVDAAAIETAAATQQHPWHLPANCPQEYLDQLTSEEFVSVLKNGRRMREWRLRKGRKANHYFDARTYLEALADAIGVRRLERAQGLVVVGNGAMPQRPVQGERDETESRRARGGGGMLERARTRRRG